MKINFKGIITVLALTVGASTAANAEFIDSGAYFTDTSSKLDWLDITVTVNQSYDAVFAQLKSGEKLDGWRYASAKEFNQMVSNFTSTTITSNERITHGGNRLDNLIKMLGVTFSSESDNTHNVFIYTNGILGGQLGDLLARNMAIILDDDRSEDGAHYSMAHYTVGYDNDRWDTIGSYLVRETKAK